MMKNDPQLIQVVFEATYRCNSKCIFCYNCWKNDYKVMKEMSIDDIREVFSKLPHFDRLAISGGEPLLRDDIEDVIEVGLEFTDQIALLTNGTLITNKVAKSLGKFDLQVQIPIHGLERTHNKLVGRKDGYRKALHGVAYLKKHGINFAITSVATSMNIQEIKQVFELGVAIGAKDLQVIRFMPGGEGLSNNHLMLSDKEYHLMLKSLNDVCGRYKVFGAIGAPNIPCRFPENKYKHIQFGDCSAGIDWLVIDPSGRARICNHSPTILGDLSKQSFSEIWNHPILRSFRNMEMIPKECDDCDKRLDCRGGCRAVAETYYGDLKAPDPLMYKKN